VIGRLVVVDPQHFQVPKQVHTHRFDDELVVLDLAGGRYFSLDAVGTAIWGHLTDGKTPDETVAAILAEYEVNESTARADVRRLTDELLAAGLLERHP
jgi:Coenzyme PQQ synthesis protein D (PqqD)